MAIASKRVTGSSITVEFSLEGQRDLMNQFNKLNKTAGRRAVTSAARFALKDVRDDARADAPWKSGLLATKGIVIKSTPRKVRTMAGAKVVYAGREYFGDNLSTDKNGQVRNFYPNLMELGWKDRSKSQKPGLGFMRGAWDRNEKRVEKIFVQVFLQNVRRALKVGGIK